MQRPATLCRWPAISCRVLVLLFFCAQLFTVGEIIEFPCNIERIVLAEDSVIPTLPPGDRPLIYVRYG